MKTINTIIADNQKIFVSGLSSLMKTQQSGFVNIVGTSQTAEDLKIQLEEKRPDLLIMELNLPDQDGLKILPEIKSDFPDLKICILSSYGDTKFVKEAFQKGADGYVAKDNDFDELLKGIREVMEGNTFLAKGLRITPANNVFGNIAKITRKSFLYEDRFQIKKKLTNREQEVLKLIAQAKNNKEIAEELYISDQTVGVHRKNIMRKLEVRNTITLIKFAMEHQLV